jgi:glycine cleavage system H lipoate-binding protein
MRCPFLQEAQVRSCQASEFKKMIVRTPSSADDKCSSSAYASCPVARQNCDENSPRDHCPFLRELLVQFCSAAPVAKYIPYSESLLSRCGTEGHRYCALYLSMVDPEAPDERNAGSTESTNADLSRSRIDDCQVEDILVPAHLAYSANHMWLEVDADGCCHIGVDGFLAKILNRVDKLSYLPAKGADRPAAVLTAHGADLQIVFPNKMIITGSNMHLRVHPERLTAHPYTLGWLFEGRIPEDRNNGPARPISEGLIRGRQALQWMQEELHRMSEFAREQILTPRLGGELLMTDGGTFTRDLLQHLSREQVLQLFNEFFSPYTSWRKQW